MYAPDEITHTARRMVQNVIGSDIMQLGRMVVRELDIAFNDLDLTGSQIVLLAHIGSERGTARSIEISAALNIEKSTMSRNLKRLVALGLIHIGPSGGRQGKTLTLTKSGAEILNRVEVRWRAVNDRIAAVLGEDNCRAVRDMIERMHKRPHTCS